MVGAGFLELRAFHDLFRVGLVGVGLFKIGLFRVGFSFEVKF